MIENYVFSNLRNDAIRVENGSLQRGLLSISCSDSSDTANLIPRMQFSWKFAEMPEATAEAYDASLRQAIAFYRQSVNVPALSACSVERRGAAARRRGLHAAPAAQALAPAPRAALRRHRRAAGAPRRQGFRDLARVAGPRNPYISVHGSLSMPTNFHALDLFVRAEGGAVFNSPHLEGFSVALRGAPHA